MSKYWIILAISTVVEVAWALSLKYAGTQRTVAAALIPITISLVNMWLLALAMRGIPAGTAYAIWTGVGAIGVAIGGALLFGDPLPPLRILFMALIVFGVVGMKLVSD